MQIHIAGASHQIDQRRSAGSGDPTARIRGRSDPVSLLRVLCEIELSQQSGAHFADLIFQKCSGHFRFWPFSSANRALATVLGTFCRQPSQTEACNQSTVVSRLERFRPWIDTFPDSYTSQLHDDVVDMMLGMLTSVTRKFSIQISFDNIVDYMMVTIQVGWLLKSIIQNHPEVGYGIFHSELRMFVGIDWHFHIRSTPGWLYVHICTYIYIYRYLSIYLSIYLSNNLSTYLPIYLSIFLSHDVHYLHVYLLMGI